ncbi:T9SS type A sorting domain-containing protein [Cryomorpha ignava]|uniref:T9SS type A sorting domain-containing protein n=1 Tax=Cryomorpha ignava TaxID=101383 RepID=A0A7K3WVW8_9FLAO|nr:T9SS type A sorting domain-containing protein [Cryomorpha ignava]NEN25654.1 T9SS type A sorting domain-containing protein [Cryomorpha ignava]
MELANEWYQTNAPYSMNSYLNAFNWYPPGNTQYVINLNEGWEHNLVTSTYLPMNNPFVQSGDYTFIHAQSAITNNRDFHWEDGWELLWMNLGKYPDGISAYGLTAGSVFGDNNILHNPNPTNIPYFVLYNRYRGVLRLFANVWKDNLQPNYQEVLIRLQFDQASVDNGISGILRSILNYDTPLDQETSGTVHWSPRLQSTSSPNWLVADFQMAFDPCICLRETNSVAENGNNTTTPGKLQFVFSTIQTLNIDLQSRGISVDQPITSASLTEDFFNMSDVNTGNYEPGQRVYTKMSDMFEEYRRQLIKYQSDLEEYNSSTSNGIIQALFSKVGKPLVDQGVNFTEFDFVVDSVKVDTAVSGLTVEEIQQKIEEVEQKFKLKNTFAEVGEDALNGLIKGLVGVGFDYLNMELFPKKSAPVKPTTPIATFSETVYKGVINDTLRQNGPQLNQPGGVTFTEKAELPSDNQFGWGYNMTDLSLYSLPAYNKVLGQVALLKTPHPLIHAELDKSPLETQFHEVLGCWGYYETNFSNTLDLQIRLDEALEIALNRTLDFNYDKTETYVGIEIEVFTPNSPMPRGTENLESEITNTNQNIYLVSDYNDNGTRKQIYNSSWVPLSDVNQHVYSIHTVESYRDRMSVGEGPLPPGCSIYEGSQYSNYDFNSEIKSIKLKFIHDMYFEQIGYLGRPINTTQVATYILYERDSLINNFNSSFESWDDTPASGQFDLYTPGIVSLGNQYTTENIDINHDMVTQVIGTTIFINAEEIAINGHITVEAGYNLVLNAVSNIHTTPESRIGQRITLKIKKDFYNTPIFNYAADSAVYNFCNEVNSYQAHISSSRVKARRELGSQGISKPVLKNNVSIVNVVSIHPNPANSQIWITSSSTPISEVQIMDISGRVLIHEKSVNSDVNRISLNISSLQSGIYLVNTKSGNESSTQKLVVEK